MPTPVPSPARPLVFAALAALLLSATAAGAGETPPTPSEAPTISIDELTPGERGYGLSVFAGRDPERFEAEVIGVMRNLAPGTSYILARLTGHGLETSGVVAGMSGSPVYFDGRLAGAVAFSWPFTHEAIAGITPIANMRGIPGAAGEAPAFPAHAPAAGTTSAGAGAGDGPPVALADLVAGRLPADLVERELARFRPAVSFGAATGIGWSLAGFDPAGEAFLARRLGPVAPAGVAAPGPGRDLAPGDAVAAVLIDGDFRMAATGTVTDVAGDTLVGFGHPILGFGPVSLPMAASEVVTVLSSQQSSFKIANLGPVVGAFEQDRQAGMRGRLGATAPTIPMRLVVHGGAERAFDLRLAELPPVTPTLLAIATMAGLGTASYSAGPQGFDLAARFRLAGHGELAVTQSFDGDNAATDVAAYLLAVAGFLFRNDFAAVELEGIDVELTQYPAPRTATLVGAHAERTRVHPGDRIGVNLDLTAYRGDPFRRRLEVEVPEDLPAGRYYLFVGDGASVDAARLTVERTEPVNLRQALDLLRSLHSRRELMVLGVVPGPGLAVAGEVLPNLPGSVRSLWTARASGSATPLKLAVTRMQTAASDVPVAGIARIDLQVDRREPVGAGEGGGGGEGGPGAETAETGEPASTAGAGSEGAESPPEDGGGGGSGGGRGGGAAGAGGGGR